MGASTSAGAGGAAPEKTAREYFDAIEEDLVKACGSCHKAGGIADAPFLAEPDRYQSITGWPAVIVGDPNQSVIITHPAEPTHGGGEAPPMPDDLQPRVIEWLTKEAANLPEQNDALKYSLPPFKPLTGGAFNTVYLNPLGDDFTNMSLSFIADELGGTSEEPTMLRISSITVHTVNQKPLHLVHPLFTVYVPSAGADPDPVDSFSNLDQVFTLATTQIVGTGEVVLTNWQKGAYLGLAFELAEVYTGEQMGEGGCKDLAGFKKDVAPAMKYCAETCHGGNDPEANATMDLSELNAATPALACLQVRARIAPGKPDESQILIVTNPTQTVVHKYKFFGKIKDYEAFKTKVSPWINAEGQ